MIDTFHSCLDLGNHIILETSFHVIAFYTVTRFLGFVLYIFLTPSFFDKNQTNYTLAEKQF